MESELFIVINKLISLSESWSLNLEKDTTMWVGRWGGFLIEKFKAFLL